MKEYMDLLGMEAEDCVTKFKGVVTSVCFDLYGCVQVAVSPAAVGEKLKHGHWFDHKRIKVTGKKPVMEVPTYAAMSPGAERGPSQKPDARAMPAR